MKKKIAAYDQLQVSNRSLGGYSHRAPNEKYFEKTMNEEQGRKSLSP
jgi:hypothetical protein